MFGRKVSNLRDANDSSLMAAKNNWISEMFWENQTTSLIRNWMPFLIRLFNSNSAFEKRIPIAEIDMIFYPKLVYYQTNHFMETWNVVDRKRIEYILQCIQFHKKTMLRTIQILPEPELCLYRRNYKWWNSENIPGGKMPVATSSKILLNFCHFQLYWHSTITSLFLMRPLYSYSIFEFAVKVEGNCVQSTLYFSKILTIARCHDRKTNNINGFTNIFKLKL